MEAIKLRGDDGRLLITPEQPADAGHWEYVTDNGREPNPADIMLQARSLRVAHQTNRTPDELLIERDRWEDEATRLYGESERLRRALQEIMEMGHGWGPGMGYSCANIAKRALDAST